MTTSAGSRVGRGPAEAVAIRPAAARDVPRVAALWSAIHAHHAPLDPQFRVRRDVERALAALVEDELREADAAVFVGEIGPDVVGFCTVRLRAAPALLAEAGAPRSPNSTSSTRIAGAASDAPSPTPRSAGSAGAGSIASRCASPRATPRGRPSGGRSASAT